MIDLRLSPSGAPLVGQTAEAFAGLQLRYLESNSVLLNAIPGDGSEAVERANLTAFNVQVPNIRRDADVRLRFRGTIQLADDGGGTIEFRFGWYGPDQVVVQGWSRVYGVVGATAENVGRLLEVDFVHPPTRVSSIIPPGVVSPWFVALARQGGADWEIVGATYAETQGHLSVAELVAA